MEVFTVDEAAQYLKLSAYTVRKLLREKRLHGVKLPGGKSWRIRKDDLETYLGGNRQAGKEGQP